MTRTSTISTENANLPLSISSVLLEINCDSQLLTDPSVGFICIAFRIETDSAFENNYQPFFDNTTGIVCSRIYTLRKNDLL